MYCDAGFVVDFFPCISNCVATKKSSDLSQNIQQYYWEMSEAEKNGNPYWILWGP